MVPGAVAFSADVFSAVALVQQYRVRDSNPHALADSAF